MRKSLWKRTDLNDASAIFFLVLLMIQIVLQKLQGLKKDIVYSGGKRANQSIKKMTSIIGVMNAGKLIPQKKVDVVIEALALLRDKYSFVFEVYGDGEQREKLEKLAEEKLYPNTYSFKGKDEHEEILSAMTKNDFFVMASENECFGLTYVEAMEMDAYQLEAWVKVLME